MNLMSDMQICRYREGRDDDGETLAFLVLWPTMFVAILLLLVHTFIVVNAQAQAEIAASAALKAAWRSADGSDFRTEVGGPNPYTGTETHPEVLKMAGAAQTAAAEIAGREQGWRWWTPGATEVSSNWCRDPGGRPQTGDAGWVQVKVQGEVFGPMAALWPGRLDRVYAVAIGPAVPDNTLLTLQSSGYALPDQGILAVC